MSGLAGLGAFAGGVAGGIQQGNTLVNSKLGREQVKQGMADRAKESTEKNDFNKALLGLMSNDPAVLDSIRRMHGQKAAPAAAPVDPALNPYQGVGLGTV